MRQHIEWTQQRTISGITVDLGTGPRTYEGHWYYRIDGEYTNDVPARTAAQAARWAEHFISEYLTPIARTTDAEGGR